VEKDTAEEESTGKGRGPESTRVSAALEAMGKTPQRVAEAELKTKGTSAMWEG